MSDNPEDFLSRWARRKSEARNPSAEPAIDPKEKTDDVVNITTDDASHAEGLEHDGATEIKENFDDVNFDELDYSSDYTRFMKEDVPDLVRRRALRQLWASDPILANLDGLNEYDEDYTDAALAVKVLQSAWKPGKGYATDDEAVEEASATAEEHPNDDGDAEPRLAEETTGETASDHINDEERAEYADKAFDELAPDSEEPLS